MMPVRSQLIRGAKTVVDLVILAVAFALALLSEFGRAFPGIIGWIVLAALPGIVAVQYLCLVAFGGPKLAWRCISLSGAVRILFGLAAATATLVLLRLAAELLHPAFLGRQYLGIPFAVLLIDFGLSAFGLIGARVVWGWWMERREQNRLQLASTRRLRTVLCGTTPASIQAARELALRPQAGVELLGFLDDDAVKHGRVFHDLPVLGAFADLREIVREYAVEQVLIPLPEDGKRVRQIVQRCEACGVPASVVGSSGEGDEKVNQSRVRKLSIEDLLRRPPVRLNGPEVASMIHGASVLITGAGGSIGSELCRAVCSYEPASLALVEQAENNLFQIHRRLSQEFPRITLVPVIADITDASRVNQVLLAQRPSVIFHAAAHKHVPMMEWNVDEAIKNNVLGTRRLADLAHAHGVNYFVMISTDKAVRPTSVMGVSKRVAELYVQALAQHSRTCFVTVRFGNVLGSTGSVVPIFQEQIARGGPVTVTHPEMTRYFMTIPEACQLILEAASLGSGGEIFILDMGEPVKIVDLAQDLIRLSGLVPGKDIEIRFTGIRPGERLYEELSLTEENASRTLHPRIYIGRLEVHDLNKIRRQVEELGLVANCGDPQRMRAKLKEIVPEFGPPARSPAAEPPAQAGPQTEPVPVAAPGNGICV